MKIKLIAFIYDAMVNTVSIMLTSELISTLLQRSCDFFQDVALGHSIRYDTSMLFGCLGSENVNMFFICCLCIKLIKYNINLLFFVKFFNFAQKLP